MKKINFILFCLLILCSSLSAQELFKFYNNKSKLYEEGDVKVGLVLSGGGSRAFAHIGVLKEIEKAGIRIDYIGGTSMGAVVGALYASGYTVHQIDSIFKSTDFSRLLQEKVSRSIKGPYEKMEEDRYALALPFDGFKPSLPSSLAKSQGLYNLMVQLLQPVNQMNDFSKLSIPFYCMATDLETGDAVVLDSGYMPIALAATTAFPTLITPVSLDSNLLIDGGVVDNYPIDEMLTKNMDYIIGVDVQQKLMTKDEIKNGTDVLMQVTSFYDHRIIVRKQEQTDVYISPKLNEYSLLDFDYRYKIINEGQKAAAEKKDIFKEISKKQAKKIQIRKPQKIPDSLVIKNVVVPENMKSEMTFVKKRLGFVFNKPIALEKFFHSINTTLASDKYNEVYYRLISSGDGSQLVDLRLQRRQESLFLKLGIHYDALYKSGALVGLAKKQLITPEDRFIFDVVVGDNIRYNLEYVFEPIGFWSLHFKSLYNSFNTNVFSDTSLSSRVFLLQNINYTSSTLKNQLYGSIYLKSYAYLKSGLQHNYIVNQTSNSFLRQFSSDNTNFNFENSHIMSFFANAVIDRYDNFYFPRKGYFFDAKAHFYFSSTDLNRTFSPYSIITIKSGLAIKATQSVSFKVEPSIGFSLGTDEETPVPFQYRLGGYGNNFINNAMPFYNYDFYELWGNSFARLDVALDYNFMKIHHLTLEANYANLSPSSFNFQTNFALPKYSGYSIGYGAETFVGPITVKYTFSPDKQNQLDLNSSRRIGRIMIGIGHWF